jgi:hypothetical protein
MFQLHRLFLRHHQQVRELLLPERFAQLIPVPSLS